MDKFIINLLKNKINLLQHNYFSIFINTIKYNVHWSNLEKDRWALIIEYNNVILYFSKLFDKKYNIINNNIIELEIDIADYFDAENVITEFIMRESFNKNDPCDDKYFMTKDDENDYSNCILKNKVCNIILSENLNFVIDFYNKNDTFSWWSFFHKKNGLCLYEENKNIFFYKDSYLYYGINNINCEIFSNKVELNNKIFLKNYFKKIKK